MIRDLPKLLIVMNIEGILIKYNQKSIQSLLEIPLDQKLTFRPGLDDFLNFLFIRNKLNFKIGVWTSQTSEKTDDFIKTSLGNFSRFLLFKYASPGQTEPRDLQRVWHNFPDFNNFNTIYIDYKINSVNPQENLILFPEFSNDKCLTIFQDYLRFFSYQFQDKEFNTFKDFMTHIPFNYFYNQHLIEHSPIPEGESKRFW